MFTTLTLTGIGPHTGATASAAGTTLTLDPKGPTTIRGRSRSGKTTIVHALCFLLWGTDAEGRPLPVDYIHGGEKRAEVTATSITGTVLRRSITPSRTVTRSYHGAGQEPRVIATEAAWRVEIKRFGDTALCDKKEVDIGRIVLAPFAWVPLATEKDGRPLRDLLLSVVGAGDLRATIAGLCELREKDPVDQKVAEAARAAANKAAQQAAGALEQARKALQDAEGAAVVGPTDEAIEAARAAVAAYDEAVATWRAASETRRTWLSARDAHARAAADAEAWDRRAAAVGEEPAGLTEEDDIERARLADLVAQLERVLGEAKAAHAVLENEPRPDAPALERAVRTARDRLTAARTSAELLGRVPCGGLRGLFPEHPGNDESDTVERECGACELLTQAREARDGIPALETALDEAQAAERKGAAAVQDHRRRLNDAGTAITRAAADVAGARRELAALDDRSSARIVWLGLRDALGTRPAVPELAPEPAALPEPTNPTEARDVLAAADRAAGALAQREATLTSARAAVEAAKAKADRESAEAKRLTALVEAIRKAPGVLFDERIKLLGDLGPVSLHTNEAGGVEVRIDGRAWWLASGGERIVADLAFRAALRTAARMGSLPIVVDNVQDVAGLTAPAVSGPVIFLSTQDCALCAEVSDV